MAWKPYIVKDFSGGMHDEWDDVDSKYCQRMRNMMLDINGKPYQRNGFVKFAPPPGGATSFLLTTFKIFKDLSSQLDFQRYTAFGYGSNKLYVGTGGAVTESAGVTAWTAITGIGTGYKINNNGVANARCKLQYNNQHIYAVFQDTSTFTNYLAYPKPRKVWPNGAQDTWTSANVGLPAYTGLAFNAVANNVGAHTYVYAAVYKFVYQVNGVTFTILGTPSNLVVSSLLKTMGSSAALGGGNTASITGLEYPDATVYHDLYPLYSGVPAFPNLYISLYRTVADGSTFLHLADVKYNTATYTDSTADSALGAPLYTNDGTAGYDEPMPCKLMHIVGNYAYYGGFDIASSAASTDAFPYGFMGAIQSSPGVIDSAPGSFTIATPDHLTAIESVDYYPIFFTKYGCYRVEGQIDAYGAGSPVLRTISEKVGAIHQQAVLKVDRGLVFLAFDGIYFTDGFSIKKLSDHINRWYRTWFADQSENYVPYVGGAYHAATKKFFFSTSLPLSVGAGSGSGNALIVGDMNHLTDAGGVAISYFDGEKGANGDRFSFTPVGVECFKNSLLFGDKAGYTQQALITLGPDDTPVGTDFGSDPAFPSPAPTLPVVFDYISASLDMGDRFAKKWVARIYMVFKFAVAQGGLVQAQIISYNDGAFRDDLHAAAGDSLAIIKDSIGNSYTRFWRVMRRFAQTHLRCFTKQVRIKSAYIVQLASRPNGVQTYIQGTLNQAAKTLTDSTDSPFNAGMVNMFLYLSNDSYVASYQISAATTSVLTVLDPGGTLPVNGTYDWMVMAYSGSTCPGTGFDSFALIGQGLEPGHEKAALTTDAGANT